MAISSTTLSANLRLADLLGGLSVACDLGFGLPPEEAMRSCLIATALAREQGLPEPEVADTFYTALLMHVGCSALSHETVAAWGDDRGVLGAVASTNVADPEEVAGTLMPTILAGKPPAERARIERFAASPRGTASSATTSTPAAARWPAPRRGGWVSERVPSAR